MARTYAFRDMILGNVENVCNTMAEQGYSPDEICKEGVRIYVLFSKWDDEGDEIELSELDRCYEEMGEVSQRLCAVEQALQLLGSAPAEVKVGAE